MRWFSKSFFDISMLTLFFNAWYDVDDTVERERDDRIVRRGREMMLE